MKRELTRGEAARRLGVSISRLRQLEDDGTLRARVDHRGYHMFDRRDIDGLFQHRASAPRRPAEQARTDGGRPTMPGGVKDVHRNRPPTPGHASDLGCQDQASPDGTSPCVVCGDRFTWFPGPAPGRLARSGTCFECRATERRVERGRLLRLAAAASR
ncbi:MAG: MerR family transcriptional regulator [Deltaproteobacteria bacterium]|nr:MerR family transcriptional regulator [Deltaproteobacteria bacterium]